MRNKKRMFGTNGVRGVVGEMMTPALVLKIGAALGSMRKGTIAVGRDTRTSGEALVHALKAGLLMTGCDVVDMGILPTPALQYIIKIDDRFAGGAMITASHNPPEYNGVKVIEADGTEMADDEIIRLEDRFFASEFDVVAWDGVGTEIAAPARLAEYIDAVVRYFPAGIGEGMTVVIDPGSGPAALTTPAILERMGCRVHTINARLDGTFPGRMPEPTPEGLQPLSEMVIATGADFGVAHDGDADRAVFVDNRGRYIEENYEFGLIEDYICSRNRGGIVVTPVATSRLIQDIARKHGCTVDYTPVGSIYVARRMIDLIEQGKNVSFGGEGNGGLIYPDHQFCRDGGMTAAMMVAVLASYNKRDLSDIIDELPVYHLVKGKHPAPDPAALVRAVEEAFSGETIEKIDGIKIIRDDAWALVRASGTEPMIRIMVESKDPGVADTMYREIMQVVRHA
ncbi:MAG TPA: phosphoglucosamine mutase [Candidatus Methanoculleus thermohydrogenotrophicum]|jgi:phosphomannomutase/phosphoglucomutase|nr:phosphoglucosamine mutase [Candidatus Methanoculleus thermohydrogenotrophicum]HQE09636.1 phosphoglucosamine mutase [Bacillota bacterium]NLM81966.1 phosphoglucosamine mutase [Candidatus Methanoculleus thermohydrogenotrophicum]HOB17490.1 phosphoglucosamine mutase [Candidatus Methanoculleus thermohydrogenotrophicum]HPZ37645.1 phosphoglucosamine mutase [Candidatus Methanoculleus thermohydrogenotrophicum]